MIKKIITAFLLVATLAPALAGPIAVVYAQTPAPAPAGAANDIPDLPDNCSGTIFCFIPELLAFLYNTVIQWILGVSVEILQAAINGTVGTITDSSGDTRPAYEQYLPRAAIERGWSIFLGVANVIIIFVLIFIGIATILGIESYGYKTLLAKLLIFAVLVNFSLFITTTIFEFTNNLASLIISAQEGVLGVASSFMDATTVSSLNQTQPSASGSYGFQALTIAAVLGIVLGLMLSFVLVAAAVLLITRVVVVGFLMILSPLAFVAMILPMTQSYANKWWTTLINQSIFAPIYFLLLVAGVEIMNTIAAAPAPPPPTGATSANFFAAAIEDPNSFAGFVFTKMIFAVGIMLGSLVVAQSLGGYGAATLNKWGVGIARGAGRGALRGALYVPSRTAGLVGRRALGEAGRALRNVGAYAGANGGAVGRFVGTSLNQAGRGLQNVKLPDSGQSYQDAADATIAKQRGLRGDIAAPTLPTRPPKPVRNKDESQEDYDARLAAWDTDYETAVADARGKARGRGKEFDKTIQQQSPITGIGTQRRDALVGGGAPADTDDRIDNTNDLLKQLIEKIDGGSDGSTTGPEKTQPNDGGGGGTSPAGGNSPPAGGGGGSSSLAAFAHKELAGDSARVYGVDGSSEDGARAYAGLLTDLKGDSGALKVLSEAGITPPEQGSGNGEDQVASAVVAALSSVQEELRSLENGTGEYSNMPPEARQKAYDQIMAQKGKVDGAVLSAAEQRIATIAQQIQDRERIKRTTQERLKVARTSDAGPNADGEPSEAYTLERRVDGLTGEVGGLTTEKVRRQQQIRMVRQYLDRERGAVSSAGGARTVDQVVPQLTQRPVQNIPVQPAKPTRPSAQGQNNTAQVRGTTTAPQGRQPNQSGKAAIDRILGRETQAPNTPVPQTPAESQSTPPTPPNQTGDDIIT